MNALYCLILCRCHYLHRFAIIFKISDSPFAVVHISIMIIVFISIVSLPHYSDLSFFFLYFFLHIISPHLLYFLHHIISSLLSSILSLITHDISPPLGTENVALIAGLGAASQLAYDESDSLLVHMLHLKLKLILLLKDKLSNIKVLYEKFIS